MISFPTVTIFGGPRERGRAYGEQARSRIEHSIRCYQAIFAGYAGLDRQAVRLYAARFELYLRDTAPDLVDEMQGIADGSGRAFLDILALNLRTEIMYGVGILHVAECTAFAALPEATATGHTLIGQNWDWVTMTRDSCVVLASAPDNAPAFVTVVEAGLLAKAGFNSSGLGVMTNAMASDADQGQIGMPYHLLLRRLLSASTVEEALSLLRQARRASSANYVIASKDGQAIDVEAIPGGPEGVHVIEPVAGLLAHANCFLTPGAVVVDEYARVEPGSMVRQRTMDEALAREAGSIQVSKLQDMLRSHAHDPDSICCHEIAGAHPEDRVSTLASLIVDLDEATLFLAEGNPCLNPYVRLEAASLWGAE